LRPNPHHEATDPEVVRRLIRENPWGIVPQLLDAERNLQVLGKLVEHFEREVEAPMLLDPDYARPIARGTVGIRLPISRFICKVKMSQDKDPVTQRQVIDALRRPGPYQHPALADEMALELGSADSMEAAVDVDDLAGDAAREV
jgi:hypothetical protein